MFQGKRQDSAEKNRSLPFDVAELSALILSHAHIDHSGRLPMLARQRYRGPIYATPATRDLCAIMLADSAHIQEKDAEYLARKHRPFAPPLYGQKDVVDIMERMICFPYDTPFDAAPGVRRCGTHPRIRVRRARVHGGEHPAPISVLWRRRPLGTSDHPRSTASRGCRLRRHGIDVRRP
jgi:hypothetical protein